MLTASEYNRLLHSYQIAENQFVQQTNIYFDTPDFLLKAQGMGLRIRRFENSAEATLKVPQSVGLLEVTDALSLEEVNANVQSAQFVPEAKEVLAYLRALHISIENLQLIGQLTTKRAELSIPEGKLALDESWYSQQHDFELELEVPNATFSEEDFKQFLQRFGLPFRKTQNKIARAVHAQQKLHTDMEENQ
ncbi:hypothetical protein RV04_GL001760 [Enterococcus hermanniensis]|uniref:CYTH domain-containing protein n=2 Tax=Enterococcus hermanniensis TaxID=249189 RepID=A0A1L8TPJ2_9ENTE|nr:hypothetical protein RV04_GL001760 [Enterococcus hermanniensis]